MAFLFRKKGSGKKGLSNTIKKDFGRFLKSLAEGKDFSKVVEKLKTDFKTFQKTANVKSQHDLVVVIDVLFKKNFQKYKKKWESKDKLKVETYEDSYEKFKASLEFGEVELNWEMEVLEKEEEALKKEINQNQVEAIKKMTGKDVGNDLTLLEMSSLMDENYNKIHSDIGDKMKDVMSSLNEAKKIADDLGKGIGEEDLKDPEIDKDYNELEKQIDNELENELDILEKEFQ